MRILLTRPEPDNARTAATLRALGHEAVEAPLLRIETIAGADFGEPPWSGVLLTSANGARAAAGHLRFAEIIALPVLAVGESTAKAARAAGFADVTSVDGDARDLALHAAGRFAGARSPLLYLAGEDRAGDLAGELAARGQSSRIAVIYRAVRAVQFAAAARAALEQGRIDGVLHYSLRSAESYLDCSKLLMKDALFPVHYCLSERIAAPLRLAGAARVRVAARPDEASLIGLLGSGRVSV